MLESDLIDGDSAARRACDQCRLRKIRCDKDSPCANCRTANRPCSSTGAGQRPRETRQRVLISTQYERKIDYFEARLANIENMIRDLAVSINNNTRSPPSATSTTITPLPASIPPFSSPPPDDTTTPNTLFPPSTTTPADPDLESSDSDSDPAFQGDSSMAAQTAFASAFLENNLTRTLPSSNLDPAICSALASLRQIARAQNRPAAHESRFVNAKPVPPGGVRELPMPPAHVVVAALREVRAVPLVGFATVCAFIATENFAERCGRVYFATEDYSVMAWGTVNAGLYFLLQEKAALAQGAQREKLVGYMGMCRDNLETALVNLPLLMPPRRESVEVLLLGVVYAIEISKFSIARDLNSIAATLCQTLGYHRLRAPSPDTEAKAVLFWSAYLLDKALSLRSGRAPAIQDYDITLPRYLGPAGGGEGGEGECGGPEDRSWQVVLKQWICYADFMGRAYEQLYSPAALARPQEQRAESARGLVETMVALAKEQEPLMQHTREKVRASQFDANSPFPMDMAILGDELLHWSALTLVYRAIPSPPGSGSAFNGECVHAARQAFALHQEFMDLAGESLAVKAGCIRWNIIYVPFTPLIVLFCHVLDTSDPTDLARLAAFADSLEPVCGASESVARLHRVAQALHDVAGLCVRARAAAAAQQRQEGDREAEVVDHDMAAVGSDIDMYLSQLGFMPPLAGPGGGGMDQTAPEGFGAGNASELGSWFSGNTHILGLLEEDLSEFEPRTWLS
ncbi:hypothetical protein C8A05DRAFT_14092 [Staphylotrichum tortipilum]|uniref:Zn(2)-C6 fungal-type domain-containing protein n=1 Tax=Staphylotrichum tortipilum TaxID=2831512 RepID=A0AAN6MN59_9PEZI|nr:hypothetical protein C8A05DRAFT_14092 [Staphylotrichum longicolle]